MAPDPTGDAANSDACAVVTYLHAPDGATDGVGVPSDDVGRSVVATVGEAAVDEAAAVPVDVAELPRPHPATTSRASMPRTPP